MDFALSFLLLFAVPVRPTSSSVGLARLGDDAKSQMVVVCGLPSHAMSMSVSMRRNLLCVTVCSGFWLGPCTSLCPSQGVLHGLLLGWSVAFVEGQVVWAAGGTMACSLSRWWCGMVFVEAVGTAT